MTSKITVTSGSQNTRVIGVTDSANPNTARQLNPGESAEFWVHSNTVSVGEGHEIAGGNGSSSPAPTPPSDPTPPSSKS